MQLFLSAVLVVGAVAAPGEGRVEDEGLSALTEMMRTVNAGDAKGYASLYAPGAVITLQGSGELRGRAAIEQHEVELLSQFPGARLGFYAVWQKGPLAVVHYAVNGRTSGGQSMGHEGLLFFRFDAAGLIEEERRYLDSLTPMAQLGLLGPLPARPLPKLPTAVEAHTAKGSPEESRNVATVTASLAAWDAKDGPAFLATLADDAVLDELVQPEPFVGKRDVKAYFDAWTQAVPDARTTITGILGVGDHVLVEALVRGTLKAPLGRLSASNGPFSAHRAAIVRVNGGKLAHVSAFMNGRELTKAPGQ
jgi:ketosteroid isomerase-like protein